MFIDTHCHLNIMVEKKVDELLSLHHFSVISAVVDQAKASGVEKIVNVGTSINESSNSIELAKRYPEVYATVGVHPCDTNDDITGPTLKEVVAYLHTVLSKHRHNKIVAVGEIGLDFYHKPFHKQRQIDFFKAQIECALEYKLPLVVHVREAGDELLRVLEEYVTHGLRGVIHCFSQKKDFADTVLAWGLYVGLDAPITYPKNDWLRDIFKDIPLERILLETDAPFLPPQKIRGTQNSPAYIALTAQALADIKGVELSLIEQVTTQNALSLFFDYTV